MIPCPNFEMQFPCISCGYDTIHTIIFESFDSKTQKVFFYAICLVCYEEKGEEMLHPRYKIDAKSWDDVTEFLDQNHSS